MSKRENTILLYDYFLQNFVKMIVNKDEKRMDTL